MKDCHIEGLTAVRYLIKAIVEDNTLPVNERNEIIGVVKQYAEEGLANVKKYPYSGGNP